MGLLVGFYVLFVGGGLFCDCTLLIALCYGLCFVTLLVVDTLC